MQVLRQGMKGAAVKRWQLFLRGQGFTILADGDFGAKSTAATKEFQKKHGLGQDGEVGAQTIAKAIALGFPLVVDDPSVLNGPSWPSKPSFEALAGNAARAAIFGKFEFVAAPTSDNPEAIKILGDWEERNIVRVELPQLAGVSGAPSSHHVRFHRLAATQLKNLWIAWDDAGLLPRVKTWDGSFVARFVRGSRTSLSNHAFGSAFDINFEWNQLGATPALRGKVGTVRELVGIAGENGFYWGGHFTRLDGMHFEIAKLT
jgi:hypothetical protein